MLTIDKFNVDFTIDKKDNELLVEFFDSRYPHTPKGQFVSRYYVKTLLGHEGFYGSRLTDGLCLHGGVPEWTIYEKDIPALNDFLEKGLAEHETLVS